MHRELLPTIQDPSTELARLILRLSRSLVVAVPDHDPDSFVAISGLLGCCLALLFWLWDFMLTDKML
jgi:hypothetical protein